MCGRFTLTLPTFTELSEALGLDVMTPADLERLEASYRPRFNVAPRQRAWIVRMRSGLRELVQAEWGLVPRWTKSLERASRPINARAETLEEKPSFRGPFARQRCLVVADGFYEWAETPSGKRPVWFRPAEGRLLRLGAVYDTWFDLEGATQRLTFSIVTTSASEDVADVHDRMPVVVAESAASAWLECPPLESPAPIPDAVRSLLAPLRPGSLRRSFVARRVGNVRFDDPSVLEPDAEASQDEVASNTERPRARRKGVAG